MGIFFQRAFWIAVIILALGLVGGAFYLRQVLEPPRLGEDFCPVNGELPAHVVIVIDQSDPFGDNDTLWVNRVLNDVARRVPRGGRITLLALRSDRPYDLPAAYSSCSPGSPDDADPRYENPEMIRNSWQTHLVAPLQEAAQGILQETAAPQPTSPLIEAITGIRDRADFQSGVKDRRIVVISDLVQNSEDFSFFRQGVNWRAFQQSRIGGDDLPDLKDVTVEIRLVPRRQDHFTDRELRAFWREYGQATQSEVVYR